MNFNDKNRTINNNETTKYREQVLSILWERYKINKKNIYIYTENKGKKNSYKRKMKQFPETEINAKSPKKDSQ